MILLAFVGEIYDFLTTLNEGEQIFHGNQLALAAAALSCHGHPACKKQTILRNSAWAVGPAFHSYLQYPFVLWKFNSLH